jgi:hypothetical protein
MQPDSMHLYLQGMGWVMRGVASMAKVSVARLCGSRRKCGARVSVAMTDANVGVSISTANRTASGRA